MTPTISPRRRAFRRRPSLGSWLLVGAVAFSATWMLGGTSRSLSAEGPFLVKPYIQAGPSGDERALSLVWQARADDLAPWAVASRSGARQDWVEARALGSRVIAIEGLNPWRRFEFSLSDLAPGSAVDYRVSRDGQVVFTAAAAVPPGAGGPHRFVVFGDCAANTIEQRAVADRVRRIQPDYVAVTGDIVYSRGRASEYLHHFFSIYNADLPAADVGAPLLRSTLVYAAPGNHDLAERDLDKYPDGLSYFYNFSQPLNGPLTAVGAPSSPALKGSDEHQQAFLKAAGTAYPRMSNFSFDRGGVHWTVLDSNNYADWNAGPLRDWLEADLAAARGASWRVVAFHHPAFSSSKAHKDDQRMRLIAPVLERGNVHLVFAGHVHNYQRSKPLKFLPGPPPADGRGKPYGPNGQVEGTFTLDEAYDGQANTRPDGVIYLVTGAGGAKLYDPDQQDDPASWLPFTSRFVSRTHSVTVAEASAERLAVRQVAADGSVLDSFTITH